jgi:DNA-binding CsgD family transcriptional regulator
MVRSAELPAGNASIPSLLCCGGSPDADLIYRRLVRGGSATASVIADDLGMDLRRVTAALDELATTHGTALRPPEQGNVVWTAKSLDPVRNALPRQISRPDRCSDRHRQEMYDSAMAEPVALADHLRHLPNRALTRIRLAELVSLARHEQLAMHPEAVFDTASLQAAAPMDRELLDRGVSMRVLGVGTDGTNHVDSRSAPVKARPNYRHTTALPAKLIIMDRKVALFPVDPGDLERGYLEVSQLPVVNALVALFERCWNQAAELEKCSMPQVDLTARERALVTLLAQGHTDATAARELRVSTRSVSNMLRSLMDRLQVDNRFQLGLALGASHAVSAPTRPAPTDKAPQ